MSKTTIEPTEHSTERGKCRVFQFEQGTLIHKIERDYNDEQCVSLSFQIIDAYRYQRELTIQKRRHPGTNNYFWECHAYRHPGIRCVKELNVTVAVRLIKRLLELSEKYPTLLFNGENDNGRARHEGFVHFHDALLNGAEPSVKLLD